MTDPSGTLASEPDTRPDGPPSEAHGFLRLAILLSLVAVILCVEAVPFLEFVTGQRDARWYLSIHLGLSAATATLGWWIGAPSGTAADRIALVVQLAVWTTLAGPFGTLIAAALMVPRRVAASHPGGTAETTTTTGQGSELTRLEVLHGFVLDRRLRLERAHAIRPLLDVVMDGTQVEKLDALSLISKRYAPALAPALKRALEDKDGAVRVLAATVMAQQHNARTKRIGALQIVAKATPENPQHWSELGQAHLDYAECGLLETSRAEAEADHALTHLSRAERLDPDNAEIQARVDAVRRLAAFRRPTAPAGDLPDHHALQVARHGP